MGGGGAGTLGAGGNIDGHGGGGGRLPTSIRNTCVRTDGRSGSSTRSVPPKFPLNACCNIILRASSNLAGALRSDFVLVDDRTEWPAVTCSKR